MHIPDGFLTTPVWTALDVAAAPAIAVLARRAKSGMDEFRAPLLGVMGAFVFAAQMINFPVGLGTSGHLVGSVLLAVVLGPAAASVVMTAILAVQAFVFQDGGILALGANTFNMAIAGCLAGYAPVYLLAQTRFRAAGIAVGAFLSVLVAASLALVELLVSGVPMPTAALRSSFVLFAVSGLIEAVITVAVVKALERVRPISVQRLEGSRSAGLAVIGLGAAILAGVGILFASSAPDGLEKLAEQIGIAQRAKTLLPSAMPDYEIPGIGGVWVRKALAGLAGVGLMFLLTLGVARLLARGRAGAGGGA